MIRESRTYFSRLLCAVAITAAVCLPSLPSLAHAGDDDGVQGFSMKLKKNVFSNNDGPGNYGLVFNGGTAVKRGTEAPQFAQTEVTIKTRIFFVLHSEPRTWLLWIIR